jgi:predicted transposase/invertase (TIGR01784 family)
VLDLPEDEYASLQVLDPALDKQNPDDKRGVLDIKIITKTGKIIDVEIQVRSQRSIWKRMQYYTAKLYVEQMKSGHKYASLNKAISILIADFVLIRENGACHTRFRLYDESARVPFPDSLEINILELPKTREDGSRLHDWMRFFRAKTEEDFMAVSQNNPAIAEAYDIIKVLSGDERARAIAEAQEKTRMDFEDRYDEAYDNGLAEGMEKGRMEGLAEGREEGLAEGLLKGQEKNQKNVALTALHENLPLAMIVRLTGLSPEEINRLASEMPDPDMQQ